MWGVVRIAMVAWLGLVVSKVFSISHHSSACQLYSIASSFGVAVSRRSARGTALAGGTRGVWGVVRIAMVAWLGLVVAELIGLNTTASGRDLPFKTSDGNFTVRP